jgi:hypothetical protein
MAVSPQFVANPAPARRFEGTIGTLATLMSLHRSVAVARQSPLDSGLLFGAAEAAFRWRPTRASSRAG